MSSETGEPQGTVTPGEGRFAGPGGAAQRELRSQMTPGREGSREAMPGAGPLDLAEGFWAAQPRHLRACPAALA